MLAHMALFALFLGTGAAPAPVVASERPKIEVWTSRGDDPYATGDVVRVFFKTEQDAYVTLLRVDTDGRIHILFPRDPWGDNFARGGREYEVEGTGSSHAFRIDDYPGEGYLFAVAAADPFTYDAVASAQHWDYRLIGDDGQIRGDPYAALTDLASRLVPDGYADWDYDVVPYYVQQHYQYPRFLCYDCHSYVSYPRWNPYDYSCVRFRMVVFDDPYYYPYRYYGGTRVVFTRPYRAEPRFIFKDRRPGDVFITHGGDRPVNDSRRRDVGVRGRDLGGPGVVPPPTVQRPFRPDRPTRPDRPDDGGRSTQYERPARPESPSRPAQPQPVPPAREGRREAPDRPPQYGRPDREARPTQPERSEGGGRDTRPATPRAAPSAPRAAPRTEPRRDNGRGSGKGNEPQLRRRGS